MMVALLDRVGIQVFSRVFTIETYIHLFDKASHFLARHGDKILTFLWLSEIVDRHLAAITSHFRLKTAAKSRLYAATCDPI